MKIDPAAVHKRPISRVPDCPPRRAASPPPERLGPPDEDWDDRRPIYGLYAMLSVVAALFVLGQTLEWPPIKTDKAQVSQAIKGM